MLCRVVFCICYYIITYSIARTIIIIIVVVIIIDFYFFLFWSVQFASAPGVGRDAVWVAPLHGARNSAVPEIRRKGEKGRQDKRGKHNKESRKIQGPERSFKSCPVRVQTF